MASLRALAVCIGLPQNFTVVGHFFGYASPPPWNLASGQASLPQSLSLLTQMQRLRQTHFHLNIIRVGTDANGLLEPADEQNIDCAVQWVRDIFGAAGIGVGRVERWWHIPLTDNTGFDVIEDTCEADDLVDEFSVPNGGADCFVVDVISDPTFVGVHPWNGDGVVVESRASTFLGTARTMAHELGHLFDLGHENSKPNNIMCQSNVANPMPTSIQLNSGQIEDIKEHDLMRPAC